MVQTRSSGHVAVAGVSQVGYRHITDLSFPEMIFEASRLALDDAGLSPGDVDCVFFGSGPEFFVGVNYPEMWCADAALGPGRPFARVHTGGTVGMATFAAAYYAVASGEYKVCLAVSGDKLTEGSVQAGLATVANPLYNRRFSAGAVGGAGLGFREIMARKGHTLDDATKIAVKQRRNALKNPHAHLRMEDITEEKVRNSRVISEPLRLLDSCPTSDGAAAMILVREEAADSLGKDVAWVRGVAACAEDSAWPGRDNVDRPEALLNAAKRAYARAGIKNPADEIDVFEFYDPFSYMEYLFLEYFGLASSPEEARELVHSGETGISGSIPAGASGGVLSANTIGCAAMARAVEAVLQVTGKAGDHQVAGAKTSLAHGWGGTFQFHVVAIFSKEKPE
ncbi:MAG: thiolase domain-containing protein [bacterium]